MDGLPPGPTPLSRSQAFPHHAPTSFRPCVSKSQRCGKFRFEHVSVGFVNILVFFSSNALQRWSWGAGGGGGMGGAEARYANICRYLNEEGASGIREQKQLRAGPACRSPRALRHRSGEGGSCSLESALKQYLRSTGEEALRKLVLDTSWRCSQLLQLRWGCCGGEDGESLSLSGFPQPGRGRLFLSSFLHPGILLTPISGPH